MIVCTSCGSPNSDTESFCASCGSFLEWTGERVEAPASGPQPDEPAGPGAGRPEPGLIDRAKELLVHKPADEPVAAATGPDGARGGGSEPPAATPGSTPGSATSDIRGALTAPAPDADAPAAVVVSRRRTARVTRANTDALEVVPTEPVASVLPPGAATAPEHAPAIEPVHEAATSTPAASIATEQAARKPEPASSLPPAARPPAASPARTVFSAAPPMAGPVPADEPRSAEPGHVKPAAPRPRPAAYGSESPDDAPAPGQLVCPGCGRGNDPGRQFCRRCGASLAAASTASAAHEHWWRRLVRRRRRPIAAGERPVGLQRSAAKAAAGQRGPWNRLAGGTLLVALGTAVGVAIGYVAVPGFGAAINDAVNEVRMVIAPQYVPVAAATFGDSGAVAGHPAGAAFDENSATYWASPADAAPPTITASFARPASVAKLLITPGTSTDQPRPSRVEVTFLDAGGRILDARRLDLINSKAVQVFDVAASEASTFTLMVLETYPPGERSGVAIAEIEFQARN